jgi:hypothetical protein
VNTVGNVVANYFIGNGSQLSGIAMTDLNTMYAGKNALINGNFDFWTYSTFQNSNGYLSSDRWYARGMVANSSSNVYLDATNVPSSGSYSATIQTNGLQVANISQVIETLNCLPLIGQVVTASCQMASNFSTIPCQLTISYSTVANASPTSNTYIVLSPVGNITATSTFSTVSSTVTIPANTLSIRVTIGHTSASNRLLYVSQAQLELGSSATSFMRAGGSFSAEKLLCQRYIQNLIPTQTGANVFLGYVTYSNTTTASWLVPFIGSLRAPLTNANIIVQIANGAIINTSIGTSNSQLPTIDTPSIGVEGVLLKWTGAWGESSAVPGTTFKITSNGATRVSNVFVINEI